LTAAQSLRVLSPLLLQLLLILPNQPILLMMVTVTQLCLLEASVVSRLTKGLETSLDAYDEPMALCGSVLVVTDPIYTRKNASFYLG